MVSDSFQSYVSRVLPALLEVSSEDVSKLEKLISFLKSPQDYQSKSVFVIKNSDGSLSSVTTLTTDLVKTAARVRKVLK